MTHLFKPLTIGSLLSALAMSGASSSAFADVTDVTARYGELQAVVDAINDPDPLMRLAQLEAILKKGDATEVQLAIRTAFQVDDPNVRSLALRAHFASFRTFIISVELPEHVQAALDGNDKDLSDSWQRNALHQFLRTNGFQFAMQSEYPSSNATEYNVKALNGNYSESDQKDFTGTGNIRGGLMNIVTNVYDGNPLKCKFEFTDYESFTMVGKGSCDKQYGFQFSIRLHLFNNDKPSEGN